MIHTAALPDDDSRKPRTVLDYLLYKNNQTYAEAARQLGMSARHVRRLARGITTETQPGTRRLLEAAYQRPAHELLAPWAEPELSAAQSAGPGEPAHPTRLHQIIRQRNLSQEEAAEAIGISLTRLSKLLRNPPDPRTLRPHTRQRLCEYFGATAEELLRPLPVDDHPNAPARRRPSTGAPAPRTVEISTYPLSWPPVNLQRPPAFDTPPGPSDTTDVLRRTVLSMLALVGASTTLPSPIDLDHERAPRSLGSVEDWQETAWEYGYAYLAEPRAQVLAELAPDLVAVRADMATAAAAGADVAARELAVVAAHLAGLVAMACTHLQYSREARHAWRLARHLSDQTRHADTQAWVRGHEITSALYLRRPLPVVMRLVENARALAGPGASAGAAQILAGQAQALALIGNSSEALTAISETAEAFDNLPSAVISQTGSIFGWPEDRLRHAETYVYSRVGDVDRADAALAQALRLYGNDPRRVLSRAQVEFSRALSFVRDGDVATGMSHASAVLAGIPTNQLGQLVFAPATDVLTTVPYDDLSRGDVVSYHDQLVAAQRALLGGGR